MNNEECQKNNVCLFCEGKAYMPGIRDKSLKIPCLCKDGTYVGFLLNHEISMLKRNFEQLSNERKVLQEWAKKTSNCPKCGGDQYKTFGSLTCIECGLPGLAYWPG